MSEFEALIEKHCRGGVPFKILGNVSEVTSGATPSKAVLAYWENGTIPWLSSSEVNKGTIYEAETFISQAGYESCSTKLMPSGSVVIALAGQGKTRGMVARTRLECCTNQSLATIVPSDELDSDFLFHFLKTQYVQLRSVSSGDGTRGGLNLAMIRAYVVPIPPLEVQHEIVRILDNFTDLEAELGAELKARKKQYEHYRDTLLEFKDDLNVQWKPLGDLGIFTRGRGLPKEQLASSGVPAIHYGQLYTTYNTWAENTVSYVGEENADSTGEAFPGDLLMPMSDVTPVNVGKAVAWVGDYPIRVGGDVLVFRHKMDAKYLAFYFETGAFQRQKTTMVTGATVRHISAKSLSKILIPVATSEKQISIVAQLEVLHNLIFNVLPEEIQARKKQYEYYRDKLLTFKELAA